MLILHPSCLPSASLANRVLAGEYLGNVGNS
jgi:hypothetical protein